MEEVKKKIGILAFGSLIDNPGDEISNVETTRIESETQFNVEFSRLSSTRGNAPTLIPVEVGGKKVKAQIIVLDENVTLENAKSMLWRRELHKKNSTDVYNEPANPTSNQVVVKVLNNIEGVETVLFTSIGNNLQQELTAEYLAENAINSALSDAGENGEDGIRYLLKAKQNGIVTGLSDEYEKQILKKTNTNSLEDTIKKLDEIRIANNRKS